MAPDPNLATAGETLADASRDSAAARVARITVTLLFLAWLVDYIDRLAITLALPFIGKAFSLDKAEQGLILTVFFVTYALFQMPGGVLADRIGARKTMMIALSAWSVFTGLTAVAFNYASLLIIRAIFGASEGLFPAASMKAVTERTRPKDRLTANGLMLCSNALGSALAPLIAGPALAYFGWRHSFFLIAALGVVMAAALWRYLPRSHPGAAAAPHQPPLNSLTIRNVLSSRALWLAAATFCGFDIVGWGLVAWTPSYLMEVRHLNVRTSGILTSIPFFAGAASIPLGGLLFDRLFHDKPRRLIVPAMIATGLFLWLMIRAASVDRFILFETLAAGSLDLTYMPIFGLPLRLLPAELAGAGSGLVNFGGQFAGAVTPFIMGALADSFSFTAAFSFLILGVVLAIIAALLTPQKKESFMATLTR